MLTPNTDAASADMFRPPVNRSMRVLDRSFFRKKVHLTAACVLNNQDITRCRSYLGPDILQVDRLTSVRTDPTDATQPNGNGRKCLLLRPEIKPNGAHEYPPWYSHRQADLLLEMVRPGVKRFSSLCKGIK